MQLVSFKLSDETYGIEITKILEIILVGHIPRVSETPHYNKGLISPPEIAVSQVTLGNFVTCEQQQTLVAPLLEYPGQDSNLRPTD